MANHSSTVTLVSKIQYRISRGLNRLEGLLPLLLLHKYYTEKHSKL